MILMVMIDWLFIGNSPLESIGEFTMMDCDGYRLTIVKDFD